MLRWILWFLPLLVPAWLVWRAFSPDFAGDPVEYWLFETGRWALYFLLAVLAYRPLVYHTGWKKLMPYRRIVGVWVFFFASLHMLVYLLLELGLDLVKFLDEVTSRFYLVIGITAWLMLLALALTSNRRAMLKLGKRWKTLHKLVYLLGLLATWHFFLSVKADVREPLVYMGAWVLLMSWRSWQDRKGKTNAKNTVASVDDERSRQCGKRVLVE